MPEHVKENNRKQLRIRNAQYDSNWSIIYKYMTAKNASDKLHSNVLIFPAGSEIAFEINNALKYSKFITVFGGSSVLDHSEFVYSNYCSSFPQITDDWFIDFLNNYIEANRIDLVHRFLCSFAYKIWKWYHFTL